MLQAARSSSDIVPNLKISIIQSAMSCALFLVMVKFGMTSCMIHRMAGPACPPCELDCLAHTGSILHRS